MAAHAACVRSSYLEQAKEITDRNLAVEMAFIACSTEEARIRAYGAMTRVDPTLVEASIIKHKIDLKQDLITRR